MGVSVPTREEGCRGGGARRVREADARRAGSKAKKQSLCDLTKIISFTEPSRAIELDASSVASN